MESDEEPARTKSFEFMPIAFKVVVPPLAPNKYGYVIEVEEKQVVLVLVSVKSPNIILNKALD